MARAAFTRTAVGRMLDASPQPAYLLDEKRRIVYANQALADWLGVELESLFRLRCDYHSDDRHGEPSAAEVLDSSDGLQGGSAAIGGPADPNAIVAVLCPPPEVLGGVAMQSVIRRPPSVNSSNNPSSAWHVSHCPFGGGSDVGGVGDGSQLQGVLSIFASEVEDAPFGGRRSVDIQFKENAPAALHDAIAKMRKRHHDLFQVGGLVGVSAAMERVRNRIRLVSSPEAIATRTLVSGPPGSGKEHVARTIHVSRWQTLVDGNRVPADAATFPAIVPLDCEVIDAKQLATNVTAFVQRCAEVDAFQAPSLLLLNVDRLDPVAQDELQGFLAIEEIGLRTISTSVSSHTELLANEEYRDDLADALATFELQLPPVKDRIDDIPLLIQYFLEQQNAKGGNQRSGFTPQTLEQCVAYPWPGNVKEIAKVVRLCFAKANGSMVDVDELPAEIRLGMDAVLYPAETQQPIDLEQVLENYERELISKTLDQTKNNKAEAARRLGLNRAKLLRRISHLGID